MRGTSTFLAVDRGEVSFAELNITMLSMISGASCRVHS